MARLPLVQADLSEMREWLTPSDIREAFRIQPRFVWPDCSSLRWTLLSTVVPGGLFLRWVLPRAPVAGKAIHASWSCSTCLLWAIVAMLGFVAAACRNPGVVPRAHVKCETLAAAPPKYVTVNGVLIRQRWCSTCRVHRPLRSKHCSHCDRCVFRFDHHCTWLGNCVGLGNYRSFLLLVVAASLFFGHSMVLTFQVLRHSYRALHAPAAHGGPLHLLRQLLLANAGESLYLMYSLVMFLAFLVLLLYHAIIVACNLTTNEHVRDYYLTRNPYDVACADNYGQVFCAPYGRPIRIELDPAAHKSDNTVRVVAPNLNSGPTGKGANSSDGCLLAPEVKPKEDV